MSGGIRVARWTQIGAIARSNRPLRSLYGTFVRAVNFTRERALPIKAIRGNHCLINHNMQNQLSEICKIYFFRKLLYALWLAIFAAKDGRRDFLTTGRILNSIGTISYSKISLEI